MWSTWRTVLSSMPKILLTDILFPNKFAKWRIEEIKAFIDTGNCDILVHKIDSYSGVKFDVDYDILNTYYNLSQYNIIIFDKKYNYLNKYNKKIDGTKFNIPQSQFSYCFTKDTSFDLERYDAVYHIFLSMYKLFNATYKNKISQHKQFIHLYPGGGFSGKSSLLDISQECNLISTQPLTTEMLHSLGFQNIINVFGSTCLAKNQKVVQKITNNKPLTVAFSSMGNSAQKGANDYIKIVNEYTKKYPSQRVLWYFFGTKENVVLPNNIRHVPPMAQKDLDNFYLHNVDILINLETGLAMNGWPLGIEAMLQGVYLITTDNRNSNDYFKYTDNMLHIIDKNSADTVTDVIEKIHSLSTDKSKITAMGLEAQLHSFKHFSYQAQQQKIFNFIDEQLKVHPKSKQQNALREYYRVCPQLYVDDCVWGINSPNSPLLSAENVHIFEHNIKNTIIDKIKTHVPFTMVRYNDGEWIAMLYIKDNNMHSVHRRKWKMTGQDFVDRHLTPIIKSETKPEYYIGIASEVITKPYMMKHISPHIVGMKLFDGGLFARWSIENDLSDLLESLFGRNVIVVGPNYLSNLQLGVPFVHIPTPSTDVWNAYDVILKQIESEISVTNDPIILYSCSFVAKKLSDVFYKKYPSVTQLDIGAAFDVYSNVNTRPWHKHMRK